MIIGIDLGTTNSVAAHLSADGPRLIPNALGETLTPSVVAIDEDGKLLVGRAAKEYQVLHPDRAASIFKRYMGSDWSTKLGEQKFSPEQLSSLVLRQLKEDAESHLQQPIEDAVITVPAYFNEPQRKATLNAGRMAGLKVQRILNEPTAAALAYGLHELDGEKVLVVVDLGGGTFDVSVVDLFQGSLEVRASAGESFLGGEDFTRALAARVLEQAGMMFERTELEAPQLVSRLIQQCETAKCQLSREESVDIRVPDRLGEYHDNARVVTVSQAQFATWVQHVLGRVELPIRRALGDANLKRNDLDEVVMVGGATRMPMFKDRITQLFEKEPRCRLNPDEVVALGAAVQAGLIANHAGVEDMVVTDVSPFTLGIEISKRLGMDYQNGYFMPIINRNTTIPVSRIESVSTLQANQTEIKIKVYQGESRRVESNLLLGEFKVTNIPKGPAGQSIDIRFTYDLNGVLEVEATVVETKRKVSHVITRHARRLSDAEIQQAVDEMQTLKTHPREESSIRFLMRRAERMYQELPLFQRQMLSDLLDGFESALNEGEKDVIARHQATLEEFLDRFDQSHENDDQDGYDDG